MAKSTPIRLDENLMADASLKGELSRRSKVEQLEYWADIGRSVERVIDPIDLMNIRAGLAEIKLVPKGSKPVDPDKVFEQLDRDRADGSLEKHIRADGVRYQASRSYPGKLEALYPDGRVEIGHFKLGKFYPLESFAN